MLDKRWNHLVSEPHTRCKMPLTIPLGIAFGTRPENGRTLAEMNRQGKRNRSGRGSAASCADVSHWPPGIELLARRRQS